jgi:hypothetical protein
MDWEEIIKALAKEEFLTTIKNLDGEDLPKKIVDYIKRVERS